MRIVAFRVRGYRRFEAEGTLDLTPRVVAVVGPNEAGKSSLLDGLARVTDPAATIEFERAEFSGHARPPDEERIILSALFELEHEDREALAHVPGADAIRLWHVKRAANGEASASVIPKIPRDQTLRKEVEGDVARSLDTPSPNLKAFLDETPRDEDAESDETDTIQTRRELAADALEALRAPGETISKDSRPILEAFANSLTDFPSRVPRYARDLPDKLRQLVSDHAEPHPNAVARGVLGARCPQVRVLRENDKQLRTSYPFDEEEVPAPLENLLTVAELDWSELRSAAAEPNNPQLRSMLTQANQRLASRLKTAWKQSKISIELAEQNGALQVFPYDVDSDTHSKVEDRSDGFRSFLGLFTFTSRYADGNRKLILAIDEAEMHLHYDAQADLVKVLTQQHLAPQIIYTTHSAGCLPEDLGSAIRVVRTVEGDRSVISNAFWSLPVADERRAGFTPLLMAMGAGAVAFTPTRRAVITEGPSDALLLPALFREAMDRVPDHPLGFQVAGGLAWTPPRRLGSLEAEASHVVYLTDSDAKGRQYASDLKDANVASDRIFILRAGNTTELSIEDFVDKRTYVEVVNLLLREVRGFTDASIAASEVPNAGAAAWTEAWTRRRRIEPLSKVEVAERLLRVCRASLAYSYWDPGDAPAKTLLRGNRRSSLRRLFSGVCAQLGVDAETGEETP